MRTRTLLVGGLLLLRALATPVSAAAPLWATWNLDLGTHVPPTHFLLSVRSPTGAMVPPDLSLPWAPCTEVPGAQYCAQIGCPPTGIYDFEVVAVYAEATSDPSNTWRCQIVDLVCACAEPGVVPAVPVVRAPPPVVTPPLPPLVFTGTPPPLPQRGPEGLNLQPLGAIPLLPRLAVIPASSGT